MKRSRIVIGAVLLLLIAAVTAGVWLLRTESGLQFAVARLRAAVPELKVGAVRGMIGRSVEFENLSYRSPSVEVFIEKAKARFELSALVFGGISLETLQLKGTRIRLLPSAADASAKKNPEIALPKIRIRDLRADGIRIERPQGEPMDWTSLRASVDLSGASVNIDALRLVHADYLVDGRTRLVLDDAWMLRESSLSVRSSAGAATPFAAQLQRATKANAPFKLTTTLPLRSAIQIAPGRDFQFSKIHLSLPLQDATSLGLAADTPIAAELDIDRQATKIELSGKLSFADYHASIAPSQLQVLEQSLRIDRLPIALAGIGNLDVSGNLPFDAQGTLQLDAVTDRIQWEVPDQAPLIIAGSVAVTGSYGTLNVKPELTVEQKGLPPGRLDGNVTLAGTDIQFEALRLKLPSGALIVDGTFARDADTDAALQLQLDGFDPGLFVAEWSGSLNGSASWLGSWNADTGAAGTVSVERITGSLRGQMLDLHGTLTLTANLPGAADFEISYGSAHANVKGDISGKDSLQLAASVPDLGILDPAAGGQFQLTAARNRERWRIDAEGASLRWNDLHLGTLAIDGEVGTTWDAPVELSAKLDAMATAAVDITHAELTVTGTRGEHALQATIAHQRGSIAISATGSWADAAWSGVLDKLDLVLDAERTLRLQQPVSLSYSADEIVLQQACWIGNGEARFCVDAEQHKGIGNATMEIGAFPLAWISGWTDTAQFTLQDAIVQGNADAAWTPQGLTSGSIRITSADGRVQMTERPDLLLGYHALRIEGDFADNKGRAVVNAELLPEGHIDGSFDLGRDSNGALAYDGSINVLVTQLDAIEAFTTEVVNPAGTVKGEVRLQQDEAGFRAGGNITLQGFTADLPTLGIKLVDGTVVVDSQSDGMELSGSVKSGDGTMTFEGNWSGRAEQQLMLHIGGENVRLSNTPELILYASPDLDLQRDASGWNLTGSVDIPRARIQADRLGGGASAQSDDVVVIDDTGDTSSGSLWRARVRVHMGDDVRLRGFGFDGNLKGQLAIRQAIGRSATATGQLDVLGNYNAYGQKLTIERGGLFYSGSPLDEPSLNVRAERKIGDATAGIEITGTARRPISRVFARPAASESEALALLLTGRPLRDVHGGERSQLSGAALALGTIGGDILAKNLGLDELGVSSNSGVQGEAFTIGKYLSPRLYIGYGIGLLTRGEVFTIRYMINDRIDVEANIGERQRASVNYKIER